MVISLLINSKNISVCVCVCCFEIFLKFEIKKSYQDKSVWIYNIENEINKIYILILYIKMPRRNFWFFRREEERGGERRRECVSVSYYLKKIYCIKGIRYHIFILSYKKFSYL